MIGKKRKVIRKGNQLNRPLPNGTKYGETYIGLDRPIRNAIWGTTILVGKQKNVGRD